MHILDQKNLNQFHENEIKFQEKEIEFQDTEFIYIYIYLIFLKYTEL